jgi:hypothetical protein
MNQVHSHYDNLRVTRNAPYSVIKAAYRTLSQQYHPDKSSDPDAMRIMTILNNSYEVLSDPERRRQHDAWIARQEGVSPQATPRPVPSDGDARPEPQVRPSAAARRPAPQKREPKMPETIYFWPLVFRGLRQIPVAIWVVALIAGAIAWWPAKKDTPTEAVASREYAEATRRRVGELLSPTPEPMPATAAAPVSATAPVAVSPLTRAPNGEDWPHTAGYVPGYDVDATGGYSTLTIDNTSNDYDVYLKLTLPDAPAGPAYRHVFIPRRGQFTMEDVAPGSYEVRYRNLSSGSVAKTETFDLEEEHTASGIRYSQVSFTLYTVQHGNTKMKYLSADQF